MSESKSSRGRKGGDLEPSDPIPRKNRWDQRVSPERKSLKRDFPSDRPHAYHDLADRPHPRYEKPSQDRDWDSRRDYQDRDYESRRRPSRPHSPPKHMDDSRLRPRGPCGPGDQRLIIEKKRLITDKLHKSIQKDKKAKSSSADKKGKPLKKSSKMTAPSEANYYGPGGQIDKLQVHSTSSGPASAKANGSKKKQSPSLKSEESMGNVRKSTAPPADNDVIDLSLDDDDDSASMNPEMEPQAAMPAPAAAAAALPPPPTPTPTSTPDEAPPPAKKQKGNTDQDELASTKDKLAQLQEEVKRLKKNRSAEETLAEEKQRSRAVQKKYETLMQEYTELGKDYRRVSKCLVTATEQQMELQNGLQTEQEKRHDAEMNCKAEQEARIKLQTEMETIQVKWIRDVRELKTKLLVESEMMKPDPASVLPAQAAPAAAASIHAAKHEMKADPASGMTATAEQAAAVVTAASVQEPESVVSHIVSVKSEPVQEVKYEEEVWDM